MVVQEELEGTGGVLNVEAQGGSVAEAAASPLAAAKFEAAPTPQQVSLSNPHLRCALSRAAVTCHTGS